MSQQFFWDALLQEFQWFDLFLDDLERRQLKRGRMPKLESFYSDSSSKLDSKWEAPSRQNDKLNFRPKEEKSVPSQCTADHFIAAQQATQQVLEMMRALSAQARKEDEQPLDEELEVICPKEIPAEMPTTEV